MKREEVNKILNETETGYDFMSGKFSETRKYFWRGLEFIDDYTKKSDRILDYGCGNGRLLELFSDRDIKYIGVDISEKLIGIANEKYSSERNSFRKISSSGSLPFTDDYFNTVYSIAVFHHLPGKEIRSNAVKELYRILKADGRVIVAVWNLWQKNYLRNILRNWADKILGKSELDWNDCYITFKNNEGDIFNRYHHAFTKSEMRKLFEKAGFEIERCEIISRNIVLVGKKLPPNNPKAKLSESVV